jgi:hypothetical protein
MNATKPFLTVSLLLTILLFMTACQSISVPEDVESTSVFINYDDLSNFVGEYVNFNATIEFSYLTTCDEQIEGDNACQLYLKESPHTINIVMGLNRNNITTSGNIIFSDGSTEEADPWGQIPALFTGKVRECDEQKACVIDIYQIDKPGE